MSLGKQLTFKLPVVLGSVCFLAGCYTMLRHPATELTAAHGGDAEYSECSSCHDQGFDEPLLRDPYGYTNYGFWSYYGCPWWLTDCGLSYAYGSAGGPGWSGGGSGGAYGRRAQVDEEGRAVGSRGEVRGIPNRLPAVSPPSGGGVAAPDVNLRPSESAPGTADPSSNQGQQDGRTMKRPAETPATPGTAPPAAAPSQDSRKDDKKDKPEKDKS
jgi:hypothetical protein